MEVFFLVDVVFSGMDDLEIWRALKRNDYNRRPTGRWKVTVLLPEGPFSHPETGLAKVVTEQYTVRSLLIEDRPGLYLHRLRT